MLFRSSQRFPVRLPYVYIFHFSHGFPIPIGGLYQYIPSLFVRIPWAFSGVRCNNSERYKSQITLAKSRIKASEIANWFIKLNWINRKVQFLFLPQRLTTHSASLSKHKRKCNLVSYKENRFSHGLCNFETCAIPPVNIDGSFYISIIRCKSQFSVSIINKGSV